MDGIVAGFSVPAVALGNGKPLFLCALKRDAGQRRTTVKSTISNGGNGNGQFNCRNVFVVFKGIIADGGDLIAGNLGGNDHQTVGICTQTGDGAGFVIAVNGVGKCLGDLRRNDLLFQQDRLANGAFLTVGHARILLCGGITGDDGWVVLCFRKGDVNQCGLALGAVLMLSALCGTGGDFIHDPLTGNMVSLGDLFCFHFLLTEDTFFISNTLGGTGGGFFYLPCA